MAVPVKQKNGNYRVQIIRPNKGIFVDKRFKTKREANQYIQEIESKYSTTNKPIDTKHRFRDLIDRAKLDRFKVRTRGDEQFTDESWKLMVTRWTFLSKTAKFSTILVKDLDWKTINTKLETLKEDREWSSANKYRYVSDLSVLLRYAEKIGWVSHNPVQDAKSTDRINAPGQRNRVIKREEYKALVYWADKLSEVPRKANAYAYQTFPLFIRMLWETGCRVGELLKLQYSNIIFLKEDDDFGAQIIFPSSDTKNREEKISFVNKELAELIKSFKSKTNENRVFASRYYTPFYEVKELAGLTEPDARYGETIVFHHFRHSFATYLAQDGANEKQLKDAAGWKSISMAAKYVHSTEESVRSALLKRLE